LLFALILVSLVISGSRIHAAKSPGDLKRIRFQIATIAEHAGERRIISSALVEGPPGTDFDIELQGERFKMSAKFLTDVIENNLLKVRANLQTRRLYGTSERGLPLYEEDLQRQALQLGFDDNIILLPFGRTGGDDKLTIEITPAMTGEPVRAPSGALRPLDIKILKVSQGGVVNIQASRVPHRYAGEVALLEDGREVARASANLLLEEAQELILQPDAQAGDEIKNNPFVVRLNINQYLRGHTADEVAINFDIHRIDQQNAGKREPVGLNWGGVGKLGGDLKYDLGEAYAPRAGKKYELRFRVHIADGELVD
jgi:hypothetical protein